MSKKFEAIIFIDTNIMLDFYRIRKSDISLKYLKEIEKHKDIIITSSQVEMEFKKHRQNVILESLEAVKKISSGDSNYPTIISDAKATEMINKSKKEIETQKKKLKQRIEKILKNPSYNDQVYKSLQKLFKNKSKFNLDRENDKRFSIRKLAMKRWVLGYPPRKDKDNSIGDAVNWEWIINCANNTNKNIILVSRDGDFGCGYNNELHLNDWLLKEFKERISRKRKIILTDKLSQAFKLVSIPVTKQMEEEETTVVKQRSREEKLKALEQAVAKLEKYYGKGINFKRDED